MRASTLLVALALAGCSTTTIVTGDAAPARTDDAAAPLADAASTIDTSTIDASYSPDGGATMPSICAADEVTERLCGPICDGPDLFYWAGDRCWQIDCGRCEGRDCGRGTLRRETCEEAHASCTPQLCRETGGDWLFAADFCGHFVCGRPTDLDCEVGMPVCNCGPGKTFFEGSGCVEIDGCVPDPEVPTPEQLCTRSQGTWTTGICCPTHCGELCPLPCASDACHCGPSAVWSDLLGCVPTSECYVDGLGDALGPRHRCEDGLIPCACTGSDCPGLTQCTTPTCREGRDVCDDPA